MSSTTEHKEYISAVSKQYTAVKMHQQMTYITLQRTCSHSKRI